MFDKISLPWLIGLPEAINVHVHNVCAWFVYKTKQNTNQYVSLNSNADHNTRNWWWYCGFCSHLARISLNHIIEIVVIEIVIPAMKLVCKSLVTDINIKILSKNYMKKQDVSIKQSYQD